MTEPKKDEEELVVDHEGGTTTISPEPGLTYTIEWPDEDEQDTEGADNEPGRNEEKGTG